MAIAGRFSGRAHPKWGPRRLSRRQLQRVVFHVMFTRRGLLGTGCATSPSVRRTGFDTFFVGIRCREEGIGDWLIENQGSVVRDPMSRSTSR
uniref:Uncharacterized protein n=1 Tax=Physcomitrium patens TaxID=3218 RepID=A0A2K1KJD3_PHYPA|nr:hypothetical protein PHYPA_007556 [Physcomitrium patens]PNR53882.1 hypothetical protein PHYPA_007557 [Physcomitrium patens]PNR53884.1 hypothetical protein PHYPA_007559 [Physcomitrium patens]